MSYLPRRLVAAVAALPLALAAAAAGAHADTTSQYVYISKQTPERLYVIDDGHVVFESPINTGINAAPTPDGRFRIFSSLRKRTMKGTDPRNGRPYNDKDVPYVMYFDGGMAIHGFYRRGYGYPQSFGCIELPVYKARQLYDLLDGGLGTEVVVAQRRPQIEYAGRERKTAPNYSRSYARSYPPAYPAAYPPSVYPAPVYPPPVYPNDAPYGYFEEAMQQ